MRRYHPFFISVCCMLGPGKLDISKWVLKSMIFVVLFDRLFVDFMFNFVSWPGRPDKRRTHTEHTQSLREANKPERAEVVV